MPSEETMQPPQLRVISGEKSKETESSRFRQSIFGEGVDDPMQEIEDDQESESEKRTQENKEALDALLEIQAEKRRAIFHVVN